MRVFWVVLFGFFICQAQAAESLDDALAAVGERHFVEAEALLKQILESDAKQDEARFLLARVLAWQGHYAESSSEYKQLLGKEPDNTDYLFGQAQTLVWSGNSKEALPIIEKVEGLGSANPDIFRLHIQALAASEETSSRDKAVKLQSEAKGLFPKEDWNIVSVDVEPLAKPTELPTLRIQDALDRGITEEHNSQIGGGYNYSHLSKGKGFWRADYLDFEHRFAPRKIVYGTVQETERFSLNDLQFILGGYYPFSNGTTLNVEGNASSTHHILPENGELASLQVPMARGWYLTGELGHSEYTSSRTYHESGLLEWYFSDYRAAYTLTSTQSQGLTLFGHRLSLSRYYNDVSFITLSVSKGREVEREQDKKIFFDTTFIGVNGRHWFNKELSLIWSLESTKQDTAYTSTGLSLGLRYAF